MRPRWPAALLVTALGLTGCAKDGRDAFAFRNPFQADRDPDPGKLPPGSTLAATRVNAVGSAIAAKNEAALGMKPIFFTMGVPEVEISHNKSGMVILSEGLVERCPTDAELAAVMCHELGKMAAENGSGRRDNAEPSGPRLARDVVGGTYEPDLTRLAEDAKFERRGSRAGRDPRPDPKAIGETLFVQAGYRADDYLRMETLVREAVDNADRRASELRR
jgi:predicted Zn-dependent protease